MNSNTDRCEYFLPNRNSIGTPHYLTTTPYHYSTSVRTNPADMQAEHCLFEALIVHNGKVLMVQEDEALKDMLKDNSDGWCLPYQVWAREQLRSMTQDPHTFRIAELLEVWLVHPKKLVWKDGVMREGFMRFAQKQGDSPTEGLVENCGARVMRLTVPLVLSRAVGEDPIERFKSCAEYRWVGRQELEDGLLTVSHRVDVPAMLEWLRKAEMSDAASDA